MSLPIASLVSYKIIPAVKGGEKGIYYFLQYVGKQAVVHCFTVQENKASPNENFTTVPVLGSSRSPWRYINPFLFFAIKKQCRAKGIKHLIIEHPYYGWLGFLLKKIAGLRLIVHSHNIESSRFKTMGKWWWRILYAYEKFTHRKADYNFFITREDEAFAIEKFGVHKNKCTVITYGIEAVQPPSLQQKAACKQALCEALTLLPETKLILFNGTLDYAPNRDGLDSILQYINPLLMQYMPVPYKIIICGMRLPEAYEALKAYEDQHIMYKGFVPDIDRYFKAADIFINPITDGGGIKTKLVEALASNTPAVSYKSGAYGVPVSVTGNQLQVVPDGDAAAFARAVVDSALRPADSIPAAFFNHFSWSQIAQKAVHAIQPL